MAKSPPLLFSLKSLFSLLEETLQRLSSFQWLAALLVRLFVGYFFFETGWGKLHNLDAFTARFVQWGIPHPAFNAALSAYTECIGGGAYPHRTRYAIGFNPNDDQHGRGDCHGEMKSVTSLGDFVELDEPLYALTYFWLLVAGPGFVSGDYLIRATMQARTSNPATTKTHTNSEPG